MIGKRLRYLREQRKLSQLELAKRLDIPNQNISNYEREFRQPDYETLVKLAEFYEVTTDYLLGKSDDPQSTHEEEFEAFRNRPDLEVWYKDLPKSSEEELEMLKEMFEFWRNRNKK
ncbi:helix-turn-helix transcriptional regulator [Terribacillus sp. 179-K 1B1 HS]|uniref:helix-turn-helix domain-containing protein n=1 Tax=Terribacillus sp. 179-K 1B1 HS TaxID=3142388 RepID=UPI0039A26C28